MNLYTVCYDSASTPYLHSEQTLSETVGISDSQMLWTIYENIQLNTPGPCAPLDVEHTGSNPVGCLPDTFDREIIQLVYSGTLSNPYSASAVISDCNDLASYWDLTNNVIYPWRTDGYCNIAPKMTYNEPQYNVEPFLSLTPPFSDPVTLEPTWTDPNSYLFDGAVLGKPNYNPTGSVINRNNFDPRYLFYFWGLVSSHGDYNNGQFGLPLAATQWTNYWEARDYPIASFTFCKGSVGVTIQKYAEIKAKWQSWDFNRPYGADRFMEDEEGVCCNPIILSPGRIQLMENDGEVTAPTPPPIPGNVWAGTHISGCYTIASVEGEGTPFDPFILTLGTKLWDLPSNITYPMSRLRFPTCPPIGLEQVSITYNTSSGFSFYTFETPQYYYVTSSIDIYDGRFNNNGIFVPYQKIATGVTMSKVTDLVGTSGGDYRSGSFVIGYGQQPWWTDNGSKGECCTFSWIHDHRTNAEYDRITLILDCTGSIPPRPIRNNGFYSFTSGSIILPGKSIYGLPVENPCNYNVVCYSPNGENFGSSSITYPLVSSTHGLDEYYSSLWQNEFVQNIQSPIYQIPHKDCDFTGSMVVLERDDGTCKSPYNDESGYYHQIYPYPPQIEPFITLPTTTTLYGSSSTAPNPSASGLAWGVISPVSNSNGLQPPTNAGFDGDGFPVEGVYAWQLINNVCSNISSSCSASYTYITC
jgi:hypothetical protein